MRRHAHTKQHPGLERIFAVFAAFSMLASLMVMYAPTALAHHPDLTGSVSCDSGVPYISFTASSWTTQNYGGRYNSNIGVYVDTDSGTSFNGNEVKKATGKFLPGVGDYPVPTVSYSTPENTAQQTQSPAAQFTGSFDASAWEGSTIYLKSRADGTWWNGTASGSTGEANDVIQLAVPVCAEGVSVSVSTQACQVVKSEPLGAASFNIDPAAGATVQVYSDSNLTTPVGGALSDDVTLTLAPGTYYWKATVTGAGYELDGQGSGQFTIVPCEASTVVVTGQCSLNAQGAPVGEVQVVIDPASGATVVVSGPGGPYDFSGSGGTQELAPGDYTWQATAGAGFALTGESSGEFTVEPCSAVVVVTHSGCAIGQGGAVGSVTVEIDPDSGAVVTVSGPGGPYEFSGSGGTQTLAPGDYSWLAAPGDGFSLDGEISGEFTVEPCAAGVVVTHGDCSLNAQGAPVGEVQVVIDPASG
ncbi:MAG: hypothetical protein WBZ40_13190, partial [Acidimicrobiia bacterium]